MRSSKINEQKAVENGVEIVSSAFGTLVSVVFLVGWQFYQNELDEEKKILAADLRRKKDKASQAQIARVTTLEYSLNTALTEIEQLNKRLNVLEENQSAKKIR